MMSQWSVFTFSHADTRGRIQRETWGMAPYAGADYNITSSHSRL